MGSKDELGIPKCTHAVSKATSRPVKKDSDSRVNIMAFYELTATAKMKS